MVAVRRLAGAGIKTNVTLCFSSVQCLIAAKAGATFVSPFIGRLDDVGQEGMDVIREARVIFDNYQLATEILAASIRHPRHVVEAAMIGADVATLPPDVLKKLLLHPLTDRGLEQFLADWNKVVGRAKGLLMSALNLTEPDAFRRLQLTARERNLRLADVAARIVEQQSVLEPKRKRVSTQ